MQPPRQGGHKAPATTNFAGPEAGAWNDGFPEGGKEWGLESRRSGHLSVCVRARVCVELEAVQSMVMGSPRYLANSGSRAGSRCWRVF